MLLGLAAGSAALLSTPVCNRGTNPIGKGMSVGFYVNGASVCQTKTTAPIDPGTCTTVTCTWSTPPGVQG